VNVKIPEEKKNKNKKESHNFQKLLRENWDKWVINIKPLSSLHLKHQLIIKKKPIEQEATQFQLTLHRNTISTLLRKEKNQKYQHTSAEV